MMEQKESKGVYEVKWDKNKTTYSEPWSIVLNKKAFRKDSCIQGMVKVSDNSYQLQRYPWYKRWYKLLRYYYIPKIISKLMKNGAR